METQPPIGSQVSKAVTRRMNAPGADTIRLWTIQPLEVWHTLREQKTLYVDTAHPDFADNSDSCMMVAYDWMREQMAKRIPGYSGHYPWWAYEHFLDLRFYRFYGIPGVRKVRLGLAIPRKQALLSAYGSWHDVLNRGYLPQALAWEEAEQELDGWEQDLLSHGIDSRLYSNRIDRPLCCCRNPGKRECEQVGSGFSMWKRAAMKKPYRPLLSDWNFPK